MRPVFTRPAIIDGMPHTVDPKTTPTKLSNTPPTVSPDVQNLTKADEKKIESFCMRERFETKKQWVNRAIREHPEKFRGMPGFVDSDIVCEEFSVEQNSNIQTILVAIICICICGFVFGFFCMPVRKCEHEAEEYQRMGPMSVF